MISRDLYKALSAKLGIDPEDFREPLYVVDPLGRVVFCTWTLAELVGRPAEEIVGKLSLTLYRPEATALFLMRRTQALMGQSVPPRLKTEIRRGSGAAMPVELSVSSLESEGRVIGRVAIVRRSDEADRAAPSVAPHVEALLTLTQEEADALPYGLIVLDRSGVVVGYNEAESRLSGLARSRVLGRHFFIEIAPCTRVRAFGGLYRRMVRDGEPARR